MARHYDNVSEEFQPLSPWQYFWVQVLYGIPVIGFIFLIVHAIGAGNINRRNFARSYFCVLILALIVFGIIIAIMLATGGIAALGAALAGMGGEGA